jgi:ribosomal RNA-processing protein 7
VDVTGIVPLSERKRKIYVEPDELRKKVDTFLLAFDRQEAELRRKSKEREVDEDGFELVKPSNPGASAVPTAQVADSRKRKSRNEDMKDFYRFQLRERKVAEWSDQRRSALQDQQRLLEMKSSNKFQL